MLRDATRESTLVAARDAVLILPASTADTDAMSALMTTLTEASLMIAMDRAAMDPVVEAAVQALLFTESVFDNAFKMDCKPLVEIFPTERTEALFT
jgi:hypothetical protein